VALQVGERRFGRNEPGKYEIMTSWFEKLHPGLLARNEHALAGLFFCDQWGMLTYSKLGMVAGGCCPQPMARCGQGLRAGEVIDSGDCDHRGFCHGSIGQTWAGYH